MRHYISTATLLLCTLIFCNSSFSQDFYLLDSYGRIYNSSSHNTCTSTAINGGCQLFAGDIAYFKDTLYTAAGAGIYRSIASKPNEQCAFLGSIPESINALTVDSTGMLYGIGYNRLYRFNPTTKTSTLLGSIPIQYSSAGDLTFFKGKLYLCAFVNATGLSCLLEINTQQPSLSQLFMNLKTTSVYGAITLAETCDEVGFYITGFSNNGSDLIKVDMNRKVELNVVCHYNFFVYGAASILEGGGNNRPVVESIVTKTACSNEGNNGSITINARNTASLLTYHLNDTASNHTGFFPGLVPGTYRIRIVNEFNCFKDTTAVVSGTTSPSIEVSAVHPSCANDDGKISAKSLDPRMQLKYSITDDDFQTIDTFRNIAAGSYVVTALDEKGCMVQQSTKLTLPLIDTSAISITVKNATCEENNGILQVTAPNAAIPLTYLLNNVTTSNNGNFTHLAANNYLLSIVDAKGCRLDTTALIKTIPVPAIDSVVVTNACTNSNNSGGFTVYGSQVGAPLTYSTNNTSNNTGVFASLPAGNYALRLENKSGCFKDTTIEIATVAPPEFTVTPISPNCIANSGKIAVFTSINNTNLTYFLNGAPYTFTDTIKNLAPATYAISAQNANGCTSTKTAVLAPAKFSLKGININTRQPSCNLADGFIKTTVENSNAPVTFSLNGNRTLSGEFLNLRAGTYQLSLIDSNFCSFDTAITFHPNPIIKPFTEIKTKPSSCPASTDGSIALQIRGSEEPYQISFNHKPYAFNNVHQNLEEGSYTVRIINKNECLVDSFAVQIVTASNSICSSIYFPNAFTPNSDGRNDEFKPTVYGVLEKFQLSVYNRSGQKVFETNNCVNGWNGTFKGMTISGESFVWYSTYKFAGQGQQAQQQKGTVVLIK